MQGCKFNSSVLATILPMPLLVVALSISSQYIAVLDASLEHKAATLASMSSSSYHSTTAHVPPGVVGTITTAGDPRPLSQ